jgi:hypothetical protein
MAQGAGHKAQGIEKGVRCQVSDVRKSKLTADPRRQTQTLFLTTKSTKDTKSSKQKIT